MARKRRPAGPRVEAGTGRVLLSATPPRRPTDTNVTAAPAKKPPAGQVRTTIGKGLVYTYTPKDFPGLYTPPPTSYTPGQAVSQPGVDQYGNPTLPGSAADRPTGTTGQPNLNPPQPAAPPDHSAVYGMYGVPPDVQAGADSVMRAHSHDPDGGVGAAIAWVRGTDWYKQAFVGIDAARANGFIGTDLGSEQQYKQYVNSYNQLYQQYYGRNATPAEIANLMGGAVDPGYLGKELYGAAYWQANKPDLNYLEGAFTEGGQGKGGTLSNQQGATLGLEAAGIDSRVGQILQSKIQQAQQKLQTVFSGSLATPNLTLGPAGLAAPSLAGGKTTPDVAS